MPLPARIKNVNSKIVSVSAVSESIREEMFILFSAYYTDVDYAQFCRDMQEKTHVFLFRDKKRIIGFSTIFRKKIPGVNTGPCLFSGDTVLHADYWGGKFLQTTFYRYILSSKFRSPLRPVFWFLMSKGVKTYLMMRKNFPHSFPQYKMATPLKYQHATDQFYGSKYGRHYDPRTNVIHFDQSLGAVKGQMADPNAILLKDLDVLYFIKQNPNYKIGDELACVAEIRLRDFIFPIIKYFLKPIFAGLFKDKKGAA